MPGNIHLRHPVGVVARPHERAARNLREAHFAGDSAQFVELLGHRPACNALQVAQPISFLFEASLDLDFSPSSWAGTQGHLTLVTHF